MTVPTTHTIVVNCKSRKAAEVFVSLVKDLGALTRSDPNVTKQVVVVGTAGELADLLANARRVQIVSSTGGFDASLMLLFSILDDEPQSAAAAGPISPPPAEPF